MQMLLYFEGIDFASMKKINDMLANGWFCADLFCFTPSEHSNACGFILLEKEEDFDEDED